MGDGVKQYVFKPSDLGRESWPSGELRLEGIEKTDDPSLADIFVLPASLTNFVGDPDALGRLPYIKGKEDRLVAFDVSDHETMFPAVRDAILIRCNTRPWYFNHHPNTISYAWPVQDFSDCVNVPETGFRYDVSFQGWLSSKARTDATRSCRENADLKCDIATYSDFAGYLTDTNSPTYSPQEWDRRWNEHKRSMRESRVVLCPESIPGVFPYRFFEAMSAGRVPMLIGSNYVFPFASKIPFVEFVIQVPSDQASTAGAVASQFLRNHSDEQIIQMGRTARLFWKRWLDSADWPRTMAMAVREKLGQAVNA